MTVRALIWCITQPSPMIICGLWFCVKNKKKLKHRIQTKIYSNITFPHMGFNQFTTMSISIVIEAMSGWFVSVVTEKHWLFVI